MKEKQFFTQYWCWTFCSEEFSWNTIFTLNSAVTLCCLIKDGGRWQTLFYHLDNIKKGLDKLTGNIKTNNQLYFCVPWNLDSDGAGSRHQVLERLWIFKTELSWWIRGHWHARAPSAPPHLSIFCPFPSLSHLSLAISHTSFYFSLCEDLHRHHVLASLWPNITISTNPLTLTLA